MSPAIRVHVSALRLLGICYKCLVRITKCLITKHIQNEWKLLTKERFCKTELKYPIQVNVGERKYCFKCFSEIVYRHREQTKSPVKVASYQEFTPLSSMDAICPDNKIYCNAHVRHTQSANQPAHIKYITLSPRYFANVIY